MSNKKPIKKPAKPKKRGRKNKYDTYVEPKFKQIQEWIGEGIIEAEVCNRLGIGVSAWEDYKTKYTELTELIKKGHAKANNNVVKALLKRAGGYEYEEKEIRSTPKGKSVKIIKKQLAPDVTAQIFWLKNKLPEDYKDRRELDLSSPDGSGLKVIIIKPEDIKE